MIYIYRCHRFFLSIFTTIHLYYVTFHSAIFITRFFHHLVCIIFAMSSCFNPVSLSYLVPIGKSYNLLLIELSTISLAFFSPFVLLIFFFTKFAFQSYFDSLQVILKLFNLCNINFVSIRFDVN